MILQTINRYTKPVAFFFYVLFFVETGYAAKAIGQGNITNQLFPVANIKMTLGGAGLLENSKIVSAINQFAANAFARPVQKAFSGNQEKNSFNSGPTQPEMQSFQSVNAGNMVDLFSGDFSYNIPLMDVGGYPVNIAYRSGISMDQEASWVGLGWNINPGTITRNLRGLPDDFDGKDSIKKITSIRENKTIGVTAGAGLEVVGLPLRLGASLGVFHNNYKGWGLENSINATINSGIGSKGTLTSGLSLTNNTQEGLTITPSLEVGLKQEEADQSAGYSGSFSIAAPYNTRSGLKGLELSAGVRQFTTDGKNQETEDGNKTKHTVSSAISSVISFYSPAFTPTISMPFTSRQFTFTGKVGIENFTTDPNFFISGYVSKQGIDPQDTLLALPAYGYLNLQDGAKNQNALLDFNREKELIYRDKPAMPHIALPFYTYDAFSITGEGTGGMFRAYRGDIGVVYDHFMRTKDISDRASIDIGIPNMVHSGLDLFLNRAFTQSSEWLDQNSLKDLIHFQQNNGTYEAAYFRNPGEKSINSKQFYDGIGGDDVVAVKLFQPGISSSIVQATNYLSRYRNKRKIGDTLLTASTAVKSARDKRTQVISYLTAKEAETAGLSKYIETYTVNQFSLANCTSSVTDSVIGDGAGLPANYFASKIPLKGTPTPEVDPTINFMNWGKGAPFIGYPKDTFSIRWEGRLKAPVSGPYTFTTTSDDGVQLWLNDSSLIRRWNVHAQTDDTARVNLVAGEMYTIRMAYYEQSGKAVARLQWAYPGQVKQPIPSAYLYEPEIDSIKVNSNLVLEKRINQFRKANHISEIDVLNNDGRRYVYGIPVYNLRQKEATFAVDGLAKGNSSTGLVGYTDGVDNTTANTNGKDHYFNSEEVPAYAHSFLLTGILSSDYVDVTGNGISDDDLGEAVKFNYSKICGIGHPYKWRAPYTADSVTFNEGVKTDWRDDKGNYVYGEKELWYLHTIESKTMIATFVVENRNDLYPVSEAGHKINDGTSKRLKEINLYTKSDFLKNPGSAVPVKTVHFEYAYTLCHGVNKPVTDSGKLTLQRIWFTYNGNDKGKQNPYLFHYHTNNPEYNIKSYDRWGNFKDPLQNPGSGTGHIIPNAEYPYAIQDSATAAYNAAAWSMDSVSLPSGGSLKIDFESDDYAYVQNRRAMQMFKILGLGPDTVISNSTFNLYTPFGDNLYVFVHVPGTVSNTKEVFQKYLEGVQKIYFKIFVRMPTDQYGKGNEYISCYATLDPVHGYGRIDNNTLWIKLSGISLSGDSGGSYSPLAKAAIQFLRLNLPSKAYPGSEVGDNMDLAAGVKMIFSLADNIKSAFSSFDKTARDRSWANLVDTSRSYIRLDNPNYKKYGGGHRVKRITVYDNWNKMTGQRAATYGQEYTYTTNREINGVNMTISSGVASYEPGMGGEENPFHQPLEYVEGISVLGPVTMGYSEEPLGESLFPSASVGYSQVRVRTIHYLKTKSANGYEETKFYTSYDFPTYTDRSMLDNETKKRYKPSLANFLRINSKYYLTLSQGFKIELNDMNGKLRSQAYFAETDPNHPVTYTENFYRTENQSMDNKRLSNSVMVMSPTGLIDTAALIGKDAELMVDMREQLSVTNGTNISVNEDMFAIPAIPPFFILPSLINMAQREETRFRSVATLKVIQRYGILDSVIHIDKGSRVSTRDLMYDSETGDVVLTRTQNEFNDPVYTFTYPSHWAYDGMGLAYKNIDLVMDHIYMKDGKITSGLTGPDSSYFSSGDELLVAGKQKTGDSSIACYDQFSTFPLHTRIWAIDTSIVAGGAKSFFFVDKGGIPYNGYDISLKIIRSGRRNINTAVGAVTFLQNPLVRDSTTHQYQLVLNTNSKVVKASAAEFTQYWHRNIYCDSCLSGTQLSGDKKSCLLNIIPPIPDTFYVCKSSINGNYGACGAYIYSTYGVSYGSFIRSRIDLANQFWVNYATTSYDCPYDPPDTLGLDPGGITLRTTPLKNQRTQSLQDSSLQMMLAINYNKTPNAQTGSQAASSLSIHNLTDISRSAMNLFWDDTLGPLNRCGIWLCSGIHPDDNFEPLYEWIGFAKVVNFPTSKIYYFGMGGDNRVRVSVDDRLIKEDFVDSSSTGTIPYAENFRIWHIYPVFVTAGKHVIQFQGKNNGGPAAVGLEIYNTTEDSLRSATSYGDVHLLFSTRDIISQAFPQNNTCPMGYSLDTANGSYVCRSATRSLSYANPVNTGIFGSWRALRSLVYYGPRAETDPSATTNIRVNGSFQSFSPYWQFNSGVLKTSPDTNRWVWNSEITQYNRKGMEIENKDPLGRYNSGLYGYNLTLPTAVVQNSKERESAFDGFEDYDFLTQNCDSSCKDKRHLDFSNWRSKITTAQKHSGKSSLHLNAGEEISLAIKLSDSLVERIRPVPLFNTVSDTCLPGVTLLGSIGFGNDSVRSVFSPSKGVQMVVSAWAKEDQSCTCSSYSLNQITVVTSGGTGSSVTFKPTGNIIEGWQRYEGMFTIPTADTSMTVTLQATDSVGVYFDDFRMHPFHANMKSFVYSPVNLRLMAELDENNHATFYEYDDDGTLIRVKKETERGIMTIKETRSALLKQ